MMKKCFTWFYMLSKRLFFKWSFVAILCLIPIMIPLMGVIMDREDSGMLRVALCNAGEDENAEKIITKLLNEDGVLLFFRAETPDQAVEEIENQNADVAWIFPEDFTEAICRKVAGDHEPVVDIVKREWSVTTRIAQEKLFGAIYSEISYNIYRDYVYTLVSPEDVPESHVREVYDDLKRGKDIVAKEHLDGKEPEVELNYLTAPIRGIMSIMVVLCAILAAMYFLEDRRKGRFDWLPERRRIVPAFASCLAASLISGIAVLCSIYLAGIGGNFTTEILAMLMFVAESTCFALCLCMVFRSPGILGAALPGIIIIMLVLSPIFFNLRVLYQVRLMLPTYYYLNSLYGPSYLLSGINYCIVAVAFATAVNFFRTTKRKML